MRVIHLDHAPDSVGDPRGARVIITHVSMMPIQQMGTHARSRGFTFVEGGGSSGFRIFGSLNHDGDSSDSTNSLHRLCSGVTI